MNKSIKIALFLGFLTAGMIAGYTIGRDTSPDANQPNTARWTLVMYGKWQRLEESKGRLTLRAGGRTYSYSTGDSKVSVGYMSAEEIAAAPVPKYAFEGDLEKLVTLTVAAPVEGGIGVALLTSAGKAEVLSGPEKAIIAAATLGAGAIGFYLGHKSEPDYDNPKFEDELKKNLEFWAQTEGEFRAYYTDAVYKLAAKIVAKEMERREATRPAETRETAKPTKARKSASSSESSDPIHTVIELAMSERHPVPPTPATEDARKLRTWFLSKHPEIENQAVNDPLLTRISRAIEIMNEKNKDNYSKKH